MNDLTEIIKIFMSNAIYWLIELTKQHGFIITALAFIGFFAILSAIFNQATKIIGNLFYLVIAIPAIIILGIVRRIKRKDRLKELGEIKAFIKQKPDRLKTIIYWLLFCLFIIFILVVLYWFASKFLLPFNSLNEFSKYALKNYTYNKT